MPSRPRTHQLADESQRAFSQILPSGWVVRSITPDYGIDLQVEIFDQNNTTTGRFFNVQLKATDDSTQKGALTVSLKREHCVYYRSLDLSILIARYHSPTRKIYAKWFHSFDDYYASIGKRTISYHLDTIDELTENNVQRLSEDLKVFQKYKSPDIQLPINFRLEIQEPIIHGIPAAQIASGIRGVVSALTGVVVVSEHAPPTHAHPSIQISNQKTLVDLAGMGTSVLHTEGLSLSGMNLQAFFHDVLLSIAIAVSRIHHFNMAAKIALAASNKSSLITRPEVTIMVASWMYRTQRTADLLQISEFLFQKKENRLVSDIFMIAAVRQGGTPLTSEKSYLEEFMKRRIHKTGVFGDNQILATAHYNLGNYYRSSRKNLLTYHHYRLAAKHDPNYLNRGYFWREVAGVLFESKHPVFSAKFYERAIKLGEDISCNPLFADAMMFSGSYEESESIFTKYFEQSSEVCPEWKLKALALQIIRDNLILKKQRRMVKNALKLASAETGSSDPVECERKLDEALKQDALCDLAWFNMAVLKNRKGEKKQAFISFFMAAIITRYDVEAWNNAIALGMFLEDYLDLVPLLLMTAYNFNGEALLEQMVKFAETQLPSFPKVDFLNLMNSVISQIPKEKQFFTLRILGEGAEYKKIDFPTGH